MEFIAKRQTVIPARSITPLILDRILVWPLFSNRLERETRASATNKFQGMSDDPLTQEAEQLYEALNRLIRVHQFRDRDRICGHDISVAQCYALETLVKQGPVRSRDLAACMFLDKSTASRVVDALVRKGHAERRTHTRDRRAVQVMATARGEALYRRIRGELVGDHRALIGQLPAEVRAAAVQLLTALTESEVIRADE